ncbi:MAG: hypothetical protein ACK47B_19100 [Armatimonadota bacterium]
MEQKNCESCGYIADATARECPACNGVDFGAPYRTPTDEPTLQWGAGNEPTMAWTPGRLAVDAVDSTESRRRYLPLVAGGVLACVLAVGTMFGGEPTTVNADSGTQVALAPTGTGYGSSLELPVSPSEVTVLPQESAIPNAAAVAGQPVVTITPVYQEDMAAPARPARKSAPALVAAAPVAVEQRGPMMAQAPMMAGTSAPMEIPQISSMQLAVPDFASQAPARPSQASQPAQPPVQQPAEELAPSVQLYGTTAHQAPQVIATTELQPGVRVF